MSTNSSALANFHPHTVCITGAAKGIGAACARLFAAQGYQTAICYNSSQAKAFMLADEITKQGGCAKTFCADLSNVSQVKKLQREILNAFGAVDILINNAGIAQQKIFQDITVSDWDTMFSVNIKSMFLCCQAFLPDMVRQKWGRIINISSIWGIKGGSCEVHYSASKAAVIGFTKALAKEEGLSGITVNCIAPGVIDTDMNSNLTCEDFNTLAQLSALNRRGSPKEVAQAALFFAGPHAGFTTAQVLSVDGGI